LLLLLMLLLLLGTLLLGALRLRCFFLCLYRTHWIQSRQEILLLLMFRLLTIFEWGRCMLLLLLLSTILCDDRFLLVVRASTGAIRGVKQVCVCAYSGGGGGFCSWIGPRRRASDIVVVVHTLHRVARDPMSRCRRWLWLRWLLLLWPRWLLWL
jgi:hypothetical protein